MTARDNAETADLTLEVGSLREQLKESEGKCRALTVESEGWARQLAEATALLARAHQFGVPHPAIRRDIGAFLSSRAPAQPAAPTPLDALFGAIPDMPLESPAPEPSACPHVFAGFPVCDVCGKSERTIAAEAQLAAVRAELDASTADVFEAKDEDALLKVLQASRQNIRSLLTTAPSPGAGPGRSGK